MERIAYFKSLLENEHLLMGVIKDELLEIKKKFGDKRRTKIVKDEGELDEEDLVEEENVAVTLTHLGYIKRVPADTYKAQRRGGKGIMGITTRDNDFVKDLIMTSTHDYLMFFTNTGKAHKIKAYEVPEATRTARGTPAINFLNLLQRETLKRRLFLSSTPTGRPASSPSISRKATSLSESRRLPETTTSSSLRRRASASASRKRTFARWAELPAA